MDAPYINTIKGQVPLLYKGQHRYIKVREGYFPVDQKERIDFNRSRYIPGNGGFHRLGRT